MEAETLKGRNVTVMGLGHFGGGAGVARWLVQHGARVLLTDLNNGEKLVKSLGMLKAELDSGAISLRLGGHELHDFTHADLVVANPAVPRPWNNPFLTAAQDANVPVTVEIRLLAERLDRRRVIGVTGSAGKSTTASMIHHLLVRSGRRAHLGGNLGGSLLGSLAELRSDDWVVLELSSAMLYWLGEGAGSREARGWSPGIAVVTNISPNHVDWHGSFDHYRQSKLNILRYQEPGDPVIQGDDAQRVSIPIGLQIPGPHNQVNAQLALRAVEAAAGIHAEDGAEWLGEYTGLPHRLQLVAEIYDRRFYNDSKSTTPEATLLAVQAFDDPGRVHLIAGGYDKGSDLSPIGRLAPRLAGLYTVGATGDRIVELAEGQGVVRSCRTVAGAVQAAVDHMRDGDVLLLSPGCASWDQFTNYEERGEVFLQAVQEFAGTPQEPAASTQT